jgi:hypothetical protein
MKWTNFLRGMGSIFDIAPRPKFPEYWDYKKDNRSDLQRIGDDMRKALGKAQKKPPVDSGKV